MDTPPIEPPGWVDTIATFVGKRVLIVGDVMLDEYLIGDALRVCPEAPVPVVALTERRSVPGGAANAAANAAALGGRVTLGGVTGNDPAATVLTHALRQSRVDPAGVLTDPGRPTTTKLRILARGQQLVRVDSESVSPLTSDLTARLGDWAERAVERVDAILVSDYGKGAIGSVLAARVITAARQADRPIVIDPKGSCVNRYRGATVIKPNVFELGELVRRRLDTPTEVLEAGAWLADELPGTGVLVTRGPAGMILFRAGVSALVLPAPHSVPVYDVTGAGDTAAAAFTLALAGKLSLEVAAHVANVAAGLAVRKTGTAAVTLSELLATFGSCGSISNG